MLVACKLLISSFTQSPNQNSATTLDQKISSQYSFVRQSYKPIFLLDVSIVLRIVSKVILAYFRGFQSYKSLLLLSSRTTMVLLQYYQQTSQDQCFVSPTFCSRQMPSYWIWNVGDFHIQVTFICSRSWCLVKEPEIYSIQENSRLAMKRHHNFFKKAEFFSLFSRFISFICQYNCKNDHKKQKTITRKIIKPSENYYKCVIILMRVIHDNCKSFPANAQDLTIAIRNDKEFNNLLSCLNNS